MHGTLKAAADHAKKVAAEGNALTLGGICQCPSYLSGAGKDTVQQEFRKQCQVFVDHGLDFLLCEVRLRKGRDQILQRSIAEP